MKMWSSLAAAVLILTLVKPAMAAQEPALSDLTPMQFEKAWNAVRDLYIGDIGEARIAEIALGSLRKNSGRPELAVDPVAPQPMAQFLRLAKDAGKDSSDAQPPPFLRLGMTEILGSLEGENALIRREVLYSSPRRTGGIGIAATIKNGSVVVAGLPKNSPGLNAGLMVGDVVLAIDNNLASVDLPTVIAHLKGEPGTWVTLKIKRADTKVPFDISLQREIIYPTANEATTYKNITLITVSSLPDIATRELYSAIALAKSKPRETRGYILDLRNNTGGLLDQALLVVDLMLDSGEIFVQHTRGEPVRYRAVVGDFTEGAPLIVLVNKLSASGAEIIAAALKDNDRAILVGSATFGMGSIRTVVPLGGDDLLVLVTGRVHMPSGPTFDKVGVEPDVIIGSPDQVGSTSRVSDHFTTQGKIDRSMLTAALDDQTNVSRDLAVFGALSDDAPLAYAIRLLRQIQTSAGGRQ